ncbi:MAG: alpha/beta hydrolase fold [Haloplasmataceae bacterium]|jgi:pimeloyl-ACP methyl ester carboxylesterase|nr:alpha/beta hydrolase fold [Haloplasmataceae bacterium]
MLKDYLVLKLDLGNGETLAYRQTGKGDKTLLLIHGNMSSSIHYDTVMEELEDNYLIYAVDLRGFGDSTYNQPINSLSDFATDMEIFINKLELENLTVMGWSTGGGVALELAAEIPDIVNKVILIESVGIKGYPMFKRDEKFQPILTERISLRVDVAVDPIQVIPVLNAFQTKNKDFFRYIWNLTIYNTKQPDPERYDRYLEEIIKQRNLVDVDYALVHFNMTYEHNGVNEGTGRVDFIKADVLILQGEKDLVVPMMVGLETKKHLGDKAKLVLLKGGHSPITDDLSEFINIVKDFINN